MVSTDHGSKIIPVYYNKAFVNEGRILIVIIIIQKGYILSDADLQSLSQRRADFYLKFLKSSCLPTS